jgi:hypothetical protein
MTCTCPVESTAAKAEELMAMFPYRAGFPALFPRFFPRDLRPDDPIFDDSVFRQEVGRVCEQFRF